MKQEPQPSPDEKTAKDGPGFDPELACDICGRFGAFRIGDRALCETCYEGCGSCCPEFGKDDLWSFPEEKSDK